MEELFRGREFTNQLRFLFEKRNPVFGDEDIDVTAKDLTNKILQALNTAISLFNSGETDGGVCQSPVSLPSSDDRKSVDSGESKRILVDSGDRKVGYKRRKNSHTWVKVTPTPIDDGHAWRKYGQKEILNAKFPRSYFRCTHKKDQNCQATKQVQKTEDDPPMYHTTYMGHHTCKLQAGKLKNHQLILDSDPSDSCLINFVSNLAPKQAFNSTASSSPIVKQEFSREEKPNDQDLMTKKDLSPSSSPPPPLSPLAEFLWTDLRPFVGPTMLGSTSGISEHGDGISDIYSCTTSDQSFDMDLMVGSVINFEEDAFYFDEAFLKQ